ncbi:2257_t:CDS:2 [Cetraspora pellucida]|uniref:2257_t:CDS:1 n=1 Tax=Cetraspora pellucida TaxID=1433469 RepID=A0ACA9L358_9GLOM|nr:2257_t:CDS:2 [Cetraspora pellucida]
MKEAEALDADAISEQKKDNRELRVIVRDNKQAISNLQEQTDELKLQVSELENQVTALKT